MCECYSEAIKLGGDKMRCTECNKIYRGGKSWKISKGFYSMYASCPKHSNDNPQQEAYKDLRINPK